LADALQRNQGSNSNGLSIAMRMKKNREAATGGAGLGGPVSALDKSPFTLDSSNQKGTF